MFEVTGFEMRRRTKGTLLLTVAFAALVALVVGVYPSIAASGLDYQAYVESLPPELRNAFVGDIGGLGTIEGFLVTELYQLMWMLVLGGYFAYTTAGTLSGDADDGTLDLLLVSPVSRTRVAVGKFLGVLPSILFVNAASFLVVVGSVAAVDESIDQGALFLLHALFLVYHAAAASVGLLCSALTLRPRRSQVLAAAAVAATYIVDSVTVDTDYEWVGNLSLSRYFDPGKILVETDVAWDDVGVLVVVTVVGVVLAAELFERRDV